MALFLLILLIHLYMPSVKESAIIKSRFTRVLDRKTNLLDENGGLGSIETFCPELNSCLNYTTSGDLDSSKLNHCCLPCISNTCSGDKPHCKNGERQIEVLDNSTNLENHKCSCVKTSIGNDNLSLYGESHYRYSLLQSCPDIGNQTEYRKLVTKCIFPNEDHFSEIIPVYSKTTEQNYRNIYCAKCNNDHLDTIQWRAEITGKGMIQLLLEMSIGSKEQLAESRLVQWIPPPGTAELCIDDRYLISDCPRLKASNKYRVSCHNSKLHNPVKGYKGIYKNVFCLACNENIDSCFAKNNHSNEQGHVSMVVDTEVLSSFEADRQEQSLLLCSSGNDSNLLSSVCTRKVCPFGHMEIRNTCRPLFLKIAGTSLLYRFKILYKNTGYNKSEILTFARLFVLHPNETSEDLCAEQIEGMTVDDSFVAITVTVTKLIRQQISIYEDYKLFTRKISNYNSRTKNADAPVRVEPINDVKYKLLFGIAIHILLPFDFDSHKCLQPIAMIPIQFCDLVVFAADQCENDFITMSNGVKFYRWEYVLVYMAYERFRRCAVCYDVFVSKMKMSRGVSGSGFGLLIVMSEMNCHVLVIITMLMTKLLYLIY